MRQSVLVRVNPNEMTDRRKDLMMEPISSAIYETLMRQSIANGRAGTRANGGKIAQPVGAGAAGIGAGLPTGRKDRPATAQTGRSDREPMGIGKTGAAKAPASALERQEREPTPASRVLRLVVDNGRNGRARAPRVCPPGARPFLALVKA